PRFAWLAELSREADRRWREPCVVTGPRCRSQVGAQRCSSADARTLRHAPVGADAAGWPRGLRRSRPALRGSTRRLQEHRGSDSGPRACRTRVHHRDVPTTPHLQDAQNATLNSKFHPPSSRKAPSTKVQMCDRVTMEFWSLDTGAFLEVGC